MLRMAILSVRTYGCMVLYTANAFTAPISTACPRIVHQHVHAVCVYSCLSTNRRSILVQNERREASKTTSSVGKNGEVPRCAAIGCSMTESVLDMTC